jgi:hypothetical protein
MGFVAVKAARALALAVNTGDRHEAKGEEADLHILILWVPRPGLE